MRFAVDAHAIGRHLTGNEVYIRSLLRAFAEIDKHSEFVAYLSEPGAESLIPERFQVRRVAANPYSRLGWDLGRLIRADRPDLVHVQYTAPLFSNTPTVVTVHDVSFLEHPEYFHSLRGSQLRLTVARTVKRAARILTVSEFSRDAILRAYDIPAGKDQRYSQRGQSRISGRSAASGHRKPCTKVCSSTPRLCYPWRICSRARIRSALSRLSQSFSPIIRSSSTTWFSTGKETWFTPKVREAARDCGFASRIHFTGFVSDPVLLQLV